MCWFGVALGQGQGLDWWRVGPGTQDNGAVLKDKKAKKNCRSRPDHRPTSNCCR